MSSRRDFLKTAAAAGFPAIVPARAFGQNAPGNTIQLAQLGCGRIARVMDLPGLLKHADMARYVAVCDLDTVRATDAKEMIETEYARRFGKDGFTPVKIYGDYRQMLGDRAIDAVVISTPDHWHAQPAMEAALAGKDVWLQKPASLTIAEGRQMADTLKRTGRVFQVGSQQRSAPNWRLATELVRNGRIGKIRQIFIGLPEDPAGGSERPMPVPSNFNYEMWLGSTPMIYYTEDRAHPQSPDPKVRYDRPGWLRCEQFGAGMITGWGAHHIDIAHWGMDTEYSGPVEIEAQADFPKRGLWDVHGKYNVRAKYANGVDMFISDKFPNGVRFIGDDGWIWVSRDPAKPADAAAGKRSPGLDASDPRMFRDGIKDGELHLHASPNNDHHLDWLTAIRTRKPPATNAEIAHRSCSACLLAHAAMKLGRPLKWDPAAEHFVKDEDANRLLHRNQREPYGTDYVRAGVTTARG